MSLSEGSSFQSEDSSSADERAVATLAGFGVAPVLRPSTEPFHGVVRRDRLHDRAPAATLPPREAIPDVVASLRQDANTGLAPPRVDARKGPFFRPLRQLIYITDNAAMEAFMNNPALTFRNCQVVDLRPREVRIHFHLDFEYEEVDRVLMEHEIQARFMDDVEDATVPLDDDWMIIEDN